MSNKSDAEQTKLVGAISALQQYCTHTACEKCTVKNAIGCVLQPVGDGSSRRIHVCVSPANWDWTQKPEGVMG